MKSWPFVVNINVSLEKKKFYVGASWNGPRLVLFPLVFLSCLTFWPSSLHSSRWIQNKTCVCLHMCRVRCVTEVGYPQLRTKLRVWQFDQRWQSWAELITTSHWLLGADELQSHRAPCEGGGGWFGQLPVPPDENYNHYYFMIHRYEHGGNTIK